MKRHLTVALLLLSIAAVNVPLAAIARTDVVTVAAAAGNPECRFYRGGDGPGWTHRNISDTTTCAARKNRLSLSKFRYLVSCESGFAPHNHSPSGQHHGPVMYLPSTFRSHMGYFPKYVRANRLINSVHRPRSSILIAARYVRVYGWGPWSMGACA